MPYHVGHVEVDVGVGGKPRLHVFPESPDVGQAAFVKRVFHAGIIFVQLLRLALYLAFEQG